MKKIEADCVQCTNMKMFGLIFQDGVSVTVPVGLRLYNADNKRLTLSEVCLVVHSRGSHFPFTDPLHPGLFMCVENCSIVLVFVALVRYHSDLHQG